MSASASESSVTVVTISSIVVPSATSPKSEGARFHASTRVLNVASPFTIARDRLSHMLPLMSRPVMLVILCPNPYSSQVLKRGALAL